MDSNERSGFWSYETFVVVLMFLTMGTVFLDRFAALYLSPRYGAEFHLDNAQIGAVIGVIAIGWGISGWLFASLSDLKGRRLVLIPGVIVFSLLSVITGLTQSFLQLIGARFLMGATEGPAYNVMAATLADETSQHRRGINMGVMYSAVPLIGYAAAPIIATQLAAAAGWRAAFFIVGVPGLILGLVMLKFLREPRHHRRELAEARRARIREVFRYRNLWVSIGVATCFGIWVATTGAFQPLFLTGPDHLSLTTMGGILSLSGVGGFLGSFLIPYLSDRLGRRGPVSAGLALLAISPAAVVLVGPNPGLLALVVFAFGFGVGGLAIALTVIPTESVPRALAATAIAVPVFGLEVIGAFFGPVVAGILADHSGLQAALWFAAAAGALATVFSLFFKETAPARFGARTAGQEEPVAVSAPMP